jgi:hypothetical protein
MGNRGWRSEYYHQLRILAPEFTLEFERFREEGYMLIWPEFRDPLDLSNSEARQRLGNFWGFLRGVGGQI